MIKSILPITVLTLFVSAWSVADAPAARPRQATPVETPVSASTSPASDKPKFETEAKWVLAGYNNNEIVYQIFVTSEDPRIIRCTTDVQGFYLENGKKLDVTDRQVTTVFPHQPTQVGTWMDMDQQSGATYSMNCRAV